MELVKIKFRDKEIQGVIVLKDRFKHILITKSGNLKTISNKEILSLEVITNIPYEESIYLKNFINISNNYFKHKENTSAMISHFLSEVEREKEKLKLDDLDGLLTSEGYKNLLIINTLSIVGVNKDGIIRFNRANTTDLVLLKKHSKAFSNLLNKKYDEINQAYFIKEITQLISNPEYGKLKIHYNSSDDIYNSENEENEIGKNILSEFIRIISK